MISFFRKTLLGKFLIINLVIFIFLGIATLLYLQNLKPNLVKERYNKLSEKSDVATSVISQLNYFPPTEDKLRDLYSEKVMQLLFGQYTRLRILNQDYEVIIDTQNLKFLPTEKKIHNWELSFVKRSAISNLKEFGNYAIEQNNFFVYTAVPLKDFGDIVAIILVSENANDIIKFYEERRAIVLQIALAIFLCIGLFSVFLNRSIVRPIGLLANSASLVRAKKIQKIEVSKIINRKDEIGYLSKSMAEMVDSLHDRAIVAERFAADLTHEIRNPLASLKLATEVLPKAETSDDARKLVSVIQNDLERIERLITDYSRTLKDEADFDRSNKEKIDVIGLVRNLVKEYENNLISIGSMIKLNFYEESGSLFVYGVLGRLEQVFKNIFDNAISFSPKNGVITVKVEKKDNMAAIIVEDEGPGLNEESLEKIFERFYTDRDKLNEFGKNTGLGLNIAQSIIKQHGGQILVSNLRRDDKVIGSCFQIIIPII